MEKRRQTIFDNIKGLLIILVVVGHVLEQIPSKYGIRLDIWTAIYSFHMPAFLIVSGYLSTKTRKDPVSRIAKYFGIYICVQYLYSILRFIGGPSNKFEGGDLISPIMGVWYLLFLVYAIIVSEWSRGKADRRTILLIAVIVSLISGFDASLTNKGGVVRTFSFMPFYLFGYYYDLEMIIAKMKKKKIICALAFISIIAAVVFFYHIGWLNRYNFSGSRSYVSLYTECPFLGVAFRLLCMIIGFILSLCFYAIMWDGKSLLTYIGQESLIIYITHILFVKWFFTLLISHIGDSSKKIMLESLVAIFSLVVIPTAFKYLYTRFLKTKSQ